MVKRKNAPEPDSAIEPSPKRRSSRLKSAMTANVREFPVFRPLKVSTDSGSHSKAEPVGPLKSLQDLPEMPLDIIHEVSLPSVVESHLPCSNLLAPARSLAILILKTYSISSILLEVFGHFF